MARRKRASDPLGGRLARLAALRENPTTPAAVTELRAALADRSMHAVAKAAEIAGEFEITEREPELAASFGRLMIDPTETDKACVAKAAIIEALVRLGAEQPDIYLAGARHIQLEPVWGGCKDTAGGLRGACAMALVRIAHAQAYEVLADLLADRDTAARVGAAEAAGHGAPHVVAPLLRLKILLGDEEARVLGACFGSLLRVSPRESLTFVAGHLGAPSTEVREAAAFALGDSQLAAAFDHLRSWRENSLSREMSRVALLAIALLRIDEALDYLIELVGSAPTLTARQALEAVSVHCERPVVRERVLRAAGRRADLALQAAEFLPRVGEGSGQVEDS
ncbi:MAG TPA: hypothetical protein VKM54_22380 [Myxococcota bacterium]|nr:hypothetical protein [Myxococcota bacterium]